MEILVLKMIVLCCLFVSCLTVSLLPLKFVSIALKREGSEHRRHMVDRVLRFLNCFGGGVFLATCLMDLLPDVERKVAAFLEKQNIQTNFPIAEFITATGLFLILSVEQIAYDCKERSSRSRVEKAAVDMKRSDGNEQHQITVTADSEISPLLKHSQAHASQLSSPLNQKDYPDGSDVDPSINVIEKPMISHNRGHGHSHGTLNEGTSQQALVQHTESHDMVTSSSLRSLILLLALSLHSLFEGLALGLQSDTDQLLGIFAAIIIHKTILALSLGINFVQSNLGKRSIIQSSFCFSLMAPIGIVIGVLVTESVDSNAHNITSAVLQGLATGTFLYITFFEVLPMEMSQPGDRLLKVFCTILGFGIIVGTVFLDPTIRST